MLSSRISRRGRLLLATAGLPLLLAGCFNSTENVQLSMPALAVGKPVDNAASLSGSVKGTMKQGLTYNVAANIIVEVGDTLLIQPGVTVNFTGNYNLVVKGTLLALGTQAQPICCTVLGVTKTDQPGANPATDPAYQGKWGGILGDVTCPLMVLKWTRVEFGGGVVLVSPLSTGIANNKNTNPVFFQNPQGVLVVEDSWLYGSVNDMVAVFGGRIHVARNTFEKAGKIGGEGISVSSGTTGNVAYNLFVGAATNGIRLSNVGGRNPQTNVGIFNNTFVHCGYRRVQAGRGGSLGYEQGARGVHYNNLMVNCKYGPRVVGSGNYLGNVLVAADTANVRYGYSLNYVDSLRLANEIYPTNFLTKPQATDLPLPSSFLPAGYRPGDIYNGPAALRQANPQFANFPLPTPARRLADINTVGTANFRLAANSPAIGKGYTGFRPVVTSPAIPVSAFGATALLTPGKDLGAYPQDGSGNQH